MDKDAKIYITGGKGMVGTTLVSALKEAGYTNILLSTREEVDFLNQQQTLDYFEKHKPDYVFHLAAKVGGIVGNKTQPADFIYENVQINTNVIHAAHVAGVKKLINFGSVCIYPVHADIPVKESALLTGALEYTNEGYAIAKIAGLMMCKKYKEQYGDNFISVMPDNIYGKNDNFHQKNAHVIPMLLDRFHQAKVNGDDSVVVWGTGNPTRGFIYANDVAKGLIKIFEEYDDIEHINLGTGQEISIRELAETIKKVVGYKGELAFDTTKPDGTPRRYLDTTKMKGLGWEASYSLEAGLTEMYAWYLDNQDDVVRR